MIRYFFCILQKRLLTIHSFIVQNIFTCCSDYFNVLIKMLTNVIQNIFIIIQNVSCESRMFSRVVQNIFPCCSDYFNVLIKILTNVIQNIFIIIQNVSCGVQNICSYISCLVYRVVLCCLKYFPVLLRSFSCFVQNVVWFRKFLIFFKLFCRVV